MKWEVLNISGPREVQFGGEGSVIAEARVMRDEMGRREQVLHLAFEGGVTADLTSAVDTSDGPEDERVAVVSGNDRSTLVLVGGPVVYRVNASGRAKELTRLNRDPADEEYWETHFLETSSGIVVVYEGGVLLLTPQLVVGWQREKLYSDVFDGIEDNVISFRSDGGDRWSITVGDGEPASHA